MRWQEIIEFVIEAGFIAGVIAYLGRKAIDAYFAGRIESYKSELLRVTTEHSIRFQNLHTERAEAIKVLYEKFTALDYALGSALSPLQPAGEPALEEKIKLVSDKINHPVARPRGIENQNKSNRLNSPRGLPCFTTWSSTLLALV